MKKLFILPVLFLFALTVQAQKTLNEGVVKMELTEATSDNEQMSAVFEMMKGSETNYYFNNAKALVSQTFMGGMISMSTISDSETDEVTMLFDMMGQKMMVETTNKEMNAANETPEAKKAMENLKIDYDKATTKEILGYTCYKANVDAGTGMKVELFVTEDIKASNTLIKGLEGMQLEGFPLEMKMNTPEFKMLYTATEILNEVDPAMLKADATGYKKMTFQEFQQTMGAMGGMGF